MCDKQHSPCFLCSSTSNQSKSPSHSSSSWPSINLEVIYLLTKLLRVPKPTLVAQLKKCGDNPDSWISLCDQCILLIRSARSLHHEIHKIEKKLILIQEQVLDKIRRSTNRNHIEKGKAYHEKNSKIPDTSFQEKVKLLVKKNTPLKSKTNDDDDDSRLQEGDKLAKRFVIHVHIQKSYSKAISPIRNPIPEKIKEEPEEPLPSTVPMSPSPSSPSRPPEVPCPSPGEPQITPISTKTTTATKKFHPGFAKRFNCSECGKKFTFARFWAEHLSKIHAIRDITCPAQGCSEIFNDDLVKFQDHWKANHLTWSGKKLPCTICGTEFKNSKSYANHKRNKHPINKPKEQHFICDVCGIQKNSYIGWYQHRRNKHPEIIGRKLTRKPYKPIKQILKNQLCQLCGKTIKGQGNLRNHVKLVHEKRYSHSCHVCGIGMPAPVNLKFHLLARHQDDPVTKQLEMEEGIRLWKCEIVGCEVKFLRKDKLDKHMEKFHKDGEDSERRYKCRFCEKGFWSRQKLRWHENVHEGKGKADWKCEICGKGFDTEIYLKYHLKHTHKLDNKVENE